MYQLEMKEKCDVLWRWLVNDALCEGLGVQPSGAFDAMSREAYRSRDASQLALPTVQL
jgi:hypothetical protein